MPELKAISLVLLCVVTIQDFKYRAVSWYLFPALFCIYCTNSYLTNGLHEGSFYLSVNLIIVSLQLFGAYIYYILKNKGQKPMMKKYIGLGDILFFVVLTSVFEPFGFVLFNVVALIVAIFWYAIQILKNNNRSVTIPLAGIMAFVLSALLITELVFHNIDLDSLLL